jgi:hypothetical protein
LSGTWFPFVIIVGAIIFGFNTYDIFLILSATGIIPVFAKEKWLYFGKKMKEI